MVNKSHKPVKQCEGCLLNQGDRCAAFPVPSLKWLHDACDGYDDEELLHELGLKNDHLGAHAKKTERQEKAKMVHTIEREEAHTKFKKLKFP